MDLPGIEFSPIDKPPSLTPAEGREEPAVWVAKLAIFENWPPNKDTLLREIELHRGLNILWAMPTGTTEEVARLGGHGAGKTTFCRLIRYVLSETTPGSASFRESFNDKYGNGWVVAEVFLAGQRWLVGRTLRRRGHQSFAIKDGALTDEFPEVPPRTGYDDYRADLDAAVFGEMKLRTLADSQNNLDWRRLVQWLARDQEAHYSGLLEWRVNESDSGSPDLSHEDKANLVRLMLGLVNDEEQQLLAKYAEAAQNHEQKTRDRPKMEFAVERERRALELALEMNVDDPEAPLLMQTVENRVEELRKQTDLALASTKQDEEIDRLSNEVSIKRADWGVTNAWVSELDQTICKKEAKIFGSLVPSTPSNPKQDDPYLQALMALGPLRGYCSHPMDKAWQANCPIAHERVNDEKAPEATQTAPAAIKSEAAMLTEMKIDLVIRRQKLAPKKDALDQAETKLRMARERRQSELISLKELGKQAARLEAMLTSYRATCDDLKKWDESLKKFKGEKETVNAQLAKLTERHRDLVTVFGRLFNYLAQQMLGKAVTGTVQFVGKSIEPTLDYHGPRDSAALKVAKWLAFDLAALAFGITNKAAFHPRFLIHDSPRESDLAVGIYCALFTAAQSLEGAPGTLPAFQYIVTTTEPPPDELKCSPWLLKPVLDASIKTGRLLGVDL